MPYTARPAAGASWFSLARLVVPFQGLVPLFSFLGRFSLDGMDWVLAGIGIGIGIWIWIWLDVLVWWIQRRCWKENQWRRFAGLHNTLSGALAAPHYHQYLNRALTHRHSMLITWIAACVYFAWSPDLARTGLLVVCGVVGWITIFTHAPYPCASMPSRISVSGSARSEGSAPRMKLKELNLS
jgi:hypothetical protein